MADLDVQPKKRRSIIPWLLLGLGLIALLFFLTRRSGNDNVERAATSTTATSTTSHAATADADRDDWNTVDFNAPAANYNEITDRGINVRGTNDYAIYSLGEGVLFDEGKSTLRTDAANNLQQIATSIGQRYGNGQVRIYGYTDATGSAEANKQLAQQRAEAVRNWLSQNGKIAADHISIHPVGEAKPIASNNTSEGRQQNRRVDIIAKRS
jgi:outer membrane protein OmpA-like peptidoglycan-associated protein